MGDRDAKFIYNKKEVSLNKAIKIVTKKDIHNLYSVENKDKSIVVNISDTPFVKEN